MNPRATLIGLAFLGPPATLHAQDTDPVTFDTVVASVPEQKRRHHSDKRVVGTVRIYSIEWKDGRGSSTLGADFDVEEVRDAAGNTRSTITASRLDTRKAHTGSYVTPEIAYSVFPDGAGYAIQEFVVRAESPFRHLHAAMRGPGCLPSSFDGALSIEAVGPLLAGHDRVSHRVALGLATRTTKFGRPVVAISSTLTPRADAPAQLGGGVVEQTSYFDPADAYVFLGSESAHPATNARPWPHRQTCVLEYRDRPGGPPVPRRFTRHVRPENGEELLEYEVDYTAFEDYTPTADDFRLEGRYGLTTPAGPADRGLVGVRSADRPRAWAWGAVVAGVVVAGLVGFVAYRRRRAAPDAEPRDAADRGLDSE